LSASGDDIEYGRHSGLLLDPWPSYEGWNGRVLER